MKHSNAISRFHVDNRSVDGIPQKVHQGYLNHHFEIVLGSREKLNIDEVLCYILRFIQADLPTLNSVCLVSTAWFERACQLPQWYAMTHHLQHQEAHRSYQQSGGTARRAAKLPAAVASKGLKKIRDGPVLSLPDVEELVKSNFLVGLPRESHDEDGRPGRTQVERRSDDFTVNSSLLPSAEGMRTKTHCLSRREEFMTECLEDLVEGVDRMKMYLQWRGRERFRDFLLLSWILMDWFMIVLAPHFIFNALTDDTCHDSHSHPLLLDRIAGNSGLGLENYIGIAFGIVLLGYLFLTTSRLLVWGAVSPKKWNYLDSETSIHFASLPFIGILGIVAISYWGQLSLRERALSEASKILPLKITPEAFDADSFYDVHNNSSLLVNSSSLAFTVEWDSKALNQSKITTTVGSSETFFPINITFCLSEEKQHQQHRDQRYPSSSSFSYDESDLSSRGGGRDAGQEVVYIEKRCVSIALLGDQDPSSASCVSSLETSIEISQRSDDPLLSYRTQNSVIGYGFWGPTTTTLASESDDGEDRADVVVVKNTLEHEISRHNSEVVTTTNTSTIVLPVRLAPCHPVGPDVTLDATLQRTSGFKLGVWIFLGILQTFKTIPFLLIRASVMVRRGRRHIENYRLSVWGAQEALKQKLRQQAETSDRNQIQSLSSNPAVAFFHGGGGYDALPQLGPFGSIDGMSSLYVQVAGREDLTSTWHAEQGRSLFKSLVKVTVISSLCFMTLVLIILGARCYYGSEETRLHSTTEPICSLMTYPNGAYHLFLLGVLIPGITLPVLLCVGCCILGISGLGFIFGRR